MLQGRIGTKAGNLFELQKIGCRVPSFIALSNQEVMDLCADGVNISLEPVTWNRLKNRIQKEISGNLYAVRSAALMEDQAASSLAGQFKTCIHLSLEEVKEALEEVMTHAYHYLNRDLSTFSLIIQEYIEADYSGVVFTRHPEGRRQMLLEYHAGKGEELVSGQVVPESIEILWNEVPRVKNISVLTDVFDQIKAIETHFGHPQDIEWCIQGNEWFFLQARPITTITRDQYQGIRYLENNLPTSPFYYEQTEVAEIAPRPTLFMYSLLRQIYAQGGPVDRVYQRLGIVYRERDFLKIVGNQLYVDRDEEIKTLFPNYTYLAPQALGKPTMVGLKGFLTSIRQQGAFGKLGEIAIEPLKERVQAELDHSVQSNSLKESLRVFLSVYEIIFEVNLLAEEAVKRAQKQEPTFSLDDTSSYSVGGELTYPPTESTRWKGNSLDITDETAFVAAPIYLEKNSGKSSVDRAYQLTQLREQGRWLTVKMVNALRRALFNAQNKKNTPLLFCSIDELQKNRIDSEVCSRRERAYQALNCFSFPSELASFCGQKQVEDVRCLSKGEAEGILVRLSEIDHVIGPKILYTETLTPDLVQWFPKIKGIMSRRGGVLSHLAILAREHKIPVLSNVDVYKQGIHFGKRVKMDAGRGKIILREGESVDEEDALQERQDIR